MPLHSDSRFLPGPSGQLDSRWHGPADGPPLVLLHPHPVFGGSMGSRLVYDLCVGLAADGWRVVRFDFRGVGRSAGDYGDGLGEADDAAAVLDQVTAQTGRRPVLVGYSFGGAVAAHVLARHPEAAVAAVLVATPAQVLGSSLDAYADAPSVRVPAALVVGDHDPYVSVDQARQLASRFPRPAGLTVLPGAAHFLEPDHNPQALAAVRAALAGLVPGSGPH